MVSTGRCTRNHYVRGEHRDPVTPDDDPADPGCPAAYARCKGCQPVLIPEGSTRLICDGCDAHIARCLLDAPALVAHIRGHVRPGTYMPRQDVLREAPAPLNVAAVDDADELFSVLAGWAIGYARAVKLAGPLVEAGHVRWDASGWPVGIAAGRNPTETVTDWLLTHRQGIATTGLHPGAGPDTARVDVVAWYRDVTDTHTRISGRWPRTPAERRLPLPCPQCDRLTLHMHPPAAEGHPVQVICHWKTCGRTMTDEDYYWRVNEAKEGQR
jgi:hypothetical protein